MTLAYALAAAGLETSPGTTPIDFQTALLLVVIVCLGLIARSLAELNRRVRELTERRAPARNGASTGVVSPGGSAPAGEGVPPEVVAAIAAAIVAMDQPVRIVALSEITAEQSRHWSLEGRRQIFTSHTVR